MSTLKKIAHDCGLSIGTVSMALNGSLKIAPATRQRVVATAHRLGYSPNAAARMLRNRTTNSVVFAYIKETEGGSINSTASHAIAEELGEEGFRLDIKTAPTATAMKNLLVDLVRSRTADAFVLWGIERDVEEQGRLLESLNQSFVARGYYEQHPNWCQVDFDHRGMMYRTIDKLIELGHERIAFLNHDNDQAYAVNYRHAFEDAIRTRFDRTTPETWILLNDETFESGKRIVAAIDLWLGQPVSQRPTALAVGEAGSLVPTVEMALLARGVKIGDEPGRFAIAGAHLQASGQAMTGPTWLYRIDTRVDIFNRSIDNQLMPLLRREEPVERVIRHVPSLFRNIPVVDIWSTGAITISRGWPPTGE